MADNRFKLFRLPFLALCIILDLYSLHDIIQLSFCSKRCLRVAKQCWKKKGLISAVLYAERDPRVNLSQDLLDEKKKVDPSNQKGPEIVTLWEDEKLGIERIINNITDLFDGPIKTIEFGRNGALPNNCIRIIDSIRSLQESVKNCVLHPMDLTDDFYKYVLDNCRVTENLTIYGGPTRQFKHDWNIHLDHFYMLNSHSLTFQNVMNINCQTLRLYKSSLTNEDLNQFLKNWKNGGNSRIKFVYIMMNSLNQETITAGIDTILQPDRLRRCYQRFPVETLKLRMTTNRFPLLRLPLLILCMMLDFYSLHDIIQLSLCSKRSLRVAKQCWKKKGLVKASLYAERNPRINLSYSTTADYTFWINSTEDLRGRQTKNIRVGDAVVPSIHRRSETITYWDDKIYGIGKIVRYIKDLFDVPITSIDLESDEHPNEFIRIIDYIMSAQESVKNCFLSHMNPMDNCFKHLLDNFKITGNLSIFGGPTRQFKNDWTLQLDSFSMSNSLSLTFQNLMNINCRTLQLFESNLTNEDMNQFLKNWQNGGNSRIKFASIVISSLNQETITAGIDTILQPRGVQRYYEGMDNCKIRKSGGLDILRNDGTTGTIFSHRNTFEFGVDPTVIP